jgi:hypothetical protein
MSIQHNPDDPENMPVGMPDSMPAGLQGLQGIQGVQADAEADLCEDVRENALDAGIGRRFQRNTFIFFGLALIGGLIWGLFRKSWSLTSGIALGGVLALLNKRWLEGSIRSIMRHAIAMQEGTAPNLPPLMASGVIFRYFFVAFCFGIAVWTGLFHPLGVAIGFTSFVGGVMIEAGYQIYLALKSNRDE